MVTLRLVPYYSQTVLRRHRGNFFRPILYVYVLMAQAARLVEVNTLFKEVESSRQVCFYVVNKILHLRDHREDWDTHLLRMSYVCT